VTRASAFAAVERCLAIVVAFAVQMSPPLDRDVFAAAPGADAGFHHPASSSSGKSLAWRRSRAGSVS